MKKKNTTQGKKERQGFTLVELLVAVALFSILVAIAVGGFVRALRTQRQVAALISSESNIGLVLEQMSREIRTGQGICPIGGGSSMCSCSVVDMANDVETCQTLAFTNATGQSVVYATSTNGALTKSIDGGSTFEPITTGNAKISYFETTIFGATAGDHWPARVTISLGVVPQDPDLQSDVINLQASVSSRNIDCDASGNC